MSILSRVESDIAGAGRATGAGRAIGIGPAVASLPGTPQPAVEGLREAPMMPLPQMQPIAPAQLQPERPPVGVPNELMPLAAAPPRGAEPNSYALGLRAGHNAALSVLQQPEGTTALNQ